MLRDALRSRAGKSRNQHATSVVPASFLLPSFTTAYMSSLATVNELLAGSVGGAAQVLVGQPLDTVKTRAQIAPSLFLFLRNPA
jgi:hypothetical protein